MLCLVLLKLLVVHQLVVHGESTLEMLVYKELCARDKVPRLPGRALLQVLQQGREVCLHLGGRHPQPAHHSLAVAVAGVVIVPQGRLRLLNLHHLAVGEGLHHLFYVGPDGPQLLLRKLVPEDPQQRLQLQGNVVMGDEVVVVDHLDLTLKINIILIR